MQQGNIHEISHCKFCLAMSFVDGKLLWLLRIVALCQASTPVLYAVNFNAEKTVKVDSTVNLTVQIISSNLSLTSSPMWYRINADLPADSVIQNYPEDGNKYTTLIIDKASYSNDGGTYCLNATNQYGTSTICVVLNIYKDVDCYPDDEHVPVLSGSENHTTVEGEMVLFKCSFGDNYLPMDYYVYWELTLEDGNHITVMDYINYTDFQMKTYQDCPPSNYSCCRFTSQLSVHTNLSMNNAIVTCSAIINELTSYSSSALSVVMRPTITVPLTNVRAEEGKTVNLDCSAMATTMSDWTLFSWLKNDDTIISNPNKYSNITERNPDKSNENSLKSILTIYDISKEDEADYTCIAYYDPKVLKKFGINHEFSNQTTAALQVEQGWPLWEIIAVSVSAVVAVIIAVVTLTFCVCRRMRTIDVPSIINERPEGGIHHTPDERSPLLQSPVTNNREYTNSDHNSDGELIGSPEEETIRPLQVESDAVETDQPLAGNAVFPPSQQQKSCSSAPKVDMIILLLLVRTENNKFPPSENDGWLEDVSELLERIKHFIQLTNNEQNVIYDERLEPEHRSVYLYKVIEERNKINEVSRLLYGIYYANRRSQVAAHGSDNETTSQRVQPGNAYSQEIHHHHHHHHYNLHVDVTTGPVLHRLEEFIPDTDYFANPLYQHATDFIRLVDTKMLSPILIQNGLLSSYDMEFLLLQTIIDSEKVKFIYVKLLRLGKEGYEKFMICLKDSYAMQHTGHKDLHNKLSSQQ